MFKKIVLVSLLISSNACVSIDSLTPVNEIRSNANKVLLALGDYQSDSGTLPKHLNDLIPRYLNEIPQSPSLRFNRLESALYYDEKSDWMGNIVVCSAKVGTEYWRCRRNQ